MDSKIHCSDLSIAMNRDCLPCAKIYLQDQNLTDYELEHNRHILDEAIFCSCFEIFKFLVDNGSRNPNDMCKLHTFNRCSSRSGAHFVRYIYNNFHKFYDYSIRDEYGNTPLHICLSGRAVDYILNYMPKKYISENINIENQNKKTPLSLLVSLGYYNLNERLLLVKFLLENGADPNIKNKAGFSAIDCAKILCELRGVETDAIVEYLTNWQDLPS